MSVNAALELASSVISKLRYTLIFINSLFVQIVLYLFCVSFYVCFRYSSKWFERACCISVTKKPRKSDNFNIKTESCS